MGNSVSTPARALGVSTERAGGVVVENQPHPTSAAEAGREGKAGAASVDDCPVLRGREATNAPDQYDVYNQRIDPRNNMPLAANQAPFPGQKALLSTDRIQSNIPKGGTKSTWVYPSPQMFYNALKVRLRARDDPGGPLDNHHDHQSPLLTTTLATNDSARAKATMWRRKTWKQLYRRIIQ